MPVAFDLSWTKDAFADEQITVAAASVGLTAATFAPATGDVKPAEYALLTSETADIRYRFTGSAADATGHLLTAGGVLEIRGQNNIKNFRMIRNVGVSAVVTVSYAR